MEHNTNCTLPFVCFLNRQNHSARKLDTLPVFKYREIRFFSWTGHKLSCGCHYDTELFEYRLGVCGYVKVVVRNERCLEGFIG